MIEMYYDIVYENIPIDEILIEFHARIDNEVRMLNQYSYINFGYAVSNKIINEYVSKATKNRITTPIEKPIKIDQHHLLPKQFRIQFEKAGLDIEEYKIPMDEASHRLRPGGLHTGSDNWNKQWEVFFEEFPDAEKAQILAQLNKMKTYHGLQ